MEMALSGQKFTRPTNILNSIFLFTVNAAAKTLVSVASDAQSGKAEKWRLREHLRFMAMLMTWFAVWVLKVLMDYLPCSANPSNPYSVCLYGSTPLGRMSCCYDHLSQAPLSSALISIPSLDMVDGTPSITALERALSQIFALINQIPATSRKYTFAMAMANKIMDENAKFGHVEFLEINRTALASAFARTSTRLHSSLDRTRAEVAEAGDSLVGLWATRLMQVLPMGSYLTSCVKTVGICVNAVVSSLANDNYNPRRMGVEGHVEEIWAEKLAQELLWMTCKLKDYGGVEEAMIQWSYASDLASLSLDANPRVQGFILKISGLLFEELSGVEVKIERGVKFRLLWLWLPLLCHACNGVAYPVLSSYEKAEIQRSMEQAIDSLPALDQEVILSNWFHDFSVSASDWPNLQFSYDRWCQHTRQLVPLRT